MNIQTLDVVPWKKTPFHEDILFYDLTSYRWRVGYRIKEDYSGHWHQYVGMEGCPIINHKDISLIARLTTIKKPYDRERVSK